MLNTFKIYEELSETFETPAARKITSVLSMVYEDLQNTVTKTELNDLKAEISESHKAFREDFRDLKNALAELAQAQKVTECKVTELTDAQKVTERKVTELADAQKVTERKVTELADAQKVTERKMTELAEAQKELADAQKHTDATVTELKESQQKTDATLQVMSLDMRNLRAIVEELAQAQKETQKELRELVGEHKKTRRDLGGLSMTVGYALEDLAYDGLPKLLEEQHHISVQGDLARDYMTDNQGKQIEVNIIGSAVRDGQPLTIIGEAKSQLSKKHVDEFLKIRVNRLRGVVPNIFAVMVAFMISQEDVERYARENGVAVYYSYQLRRAARQSEQNGVFRK